MRLKTHKTGDLVYAPQSALLHTGGKTIKLDEPTLLLVAENKDKPVSNDIWCPVYYEGERWYALKKDLYEPRRKDGDKVC